MVTRLILFIQALAFFIIGIHLSSYGLPSDEVSITTYAGNQIMDSLSKTINDQNVNNITDNTKSSLSMIGFFMTIFSILEMIILFISLFRS